jgi:hypothetical protein
LPRAPHGSGKPSRRDTWMLPIPIARTSHTALHRNIAPIHHRPAESKGPLRRGHRTERAGDPRCAFMVPPPRQPAQEWRGANRATRSETHRPELPPSIQIFRSFDGPLIRNQMWQDISNGILLRHRRNLRGGDVLRAHVAVPPAREFSERRGKPRRGDISALEMSPITFRLRSFFGHV